MQTKHNGGTALFINFSKTFIIYYWYSSSVFPLDNDEDDDLDLDTTPHVADNVDLVQNAIANKDSPEHNQLQEDTVTSPTQQDVNVDHPTMQEDNQTHPQHKDMTTKTQPATRDQGKFHSNLDSQVFHPAYDKMIVMNSIILLQECIINYFECVYE